MNAVDTNVLIYLHDARDPQKQTTATALVASLRPGALLWQVACEYVAGARKLRSVGVSEQDIWNNLHVLQRHWSVILPDVQTLARAESLMQQRSLSFWDALLLGAAIEAGISTLYSEDFSGIGPLHGMSIVNPFAP
jgi:predicted nucleic acid-binding protein